MFYTDIHKNWLRENFDKYENFSGLAVAFNNQFGCDKTVIGIKNFCNRKLGLFKPGNFFTEQELNWIRENYPADETRETTSKDSAEVTLTV